MKKQLIIFALIFALTMTLLPFVFAENESEETIEIILQPQNYNYSPDAKTITYEVKAKSANDEELDFNWRILKDGKTYTEEDFNEKFPEYSWESNEVVEGNTYCSTLEISRDSGVAFDLDYAEVYCVITYGDEEKETSKAKIIIHKDVSNKEQPRITVPVEMAVFEGQTFSIECEATAKDRRDKLVYRWYYSNDSEKPLSMFNDDDLECNDSTLTYAFDEAGVYYLYCNVKFENDDQGVPGNRSSLIPIAVLTYDAVTKIDIESFDFLNIEDSVLFAYAEYDFGKGDGKKNYKITLQNADLIGFLQWALHEESVLLPEKLTDELTPKIEDEQTAQVGEIVTFTCKADFADHYQWYYISDEMNDAEALTEGTFGTTGANDAILEITAEESLDGYKFFCRVEKTICGETFSVESNYSEVIIDNQNDPDASVPTEPASDFVSSSDAESEPRETELAEEDPFEQNNENKSSDEENSESDTVSTTAIVFIAISIILSIVAIVGSALVFVKLKK